MIIAERKPFKEIKALVTPYRRVLTIGCGTCVAVCLAGGLILVLAPPRPQIRVGDPPTAAGRLSASTSRTSRRAVAVGIRATGGVAFDTVGYTVIICIGIPIVGRAIAVGIRSARGIPFDGIRDAVVIGGSVTQQFAEALGIRFVEIRTSDEDIIATIEENLAAGEMPCP